MHYFRNMSRAVWVGAILIALNFAGGCSRVAQTGKSLEFPKEKDTAVFGVSGVTSSIMTNQFGIPIPGLILHQASLIRNAAELTNSQHPHYVVFQDFLLGNLTRGRYWQQQSRREVGMGMPVMDTRSTVVTVVAVDSNRVVTDSKTFRAAHIQLNVDTNDFSRVFTP